MRNFRQQLNQAHSSNSVRLTGAWIRTGRYGDFSVGYLKTADFLTAIEDFGNPQEIELIISPVKEKKSESSPDYYITVRPRKMSESPNAEMTAKAEIRKPFKRFN